jgi:hypothetical protein
MVTSPGLLPALMLLGEGWHRPLATWWNSLLWSLVTLRDGSCNSNGYPLKWNPNIVTDMCEVLTLGSWAATGSAGIAVPAPLLNTFLGWRQYYLYLTLSRGSLTPRSLCDGPSWHSASAFFTLFWRRTVWAILDHPLVEFQCSFSMTSLTAMDFHWAQ